MCSWQRAASLNSGSRVVAGYFRGRSSKTGFVSDGAGESRGWRWSNNSPSAPGVVASSRKAAAAALGLPSPAADRYAVFAADGLRACRRTVVLGSHHATVSRFYGLDALMHARKA